MSETIIHKKRKILMPNLCYSDFTESDTGNASPNTGNASPTLPALSEPSPRCCRAPTNFSNFPYESLSEVCSERARSSINLARYLNETQQVTIRFITPRSRATTDYSTAG